MSIAHSFPEERDQQEKRLLLASGPLLPPAVAGAKLFENGPRGILPPSLAVQGAC